MSEGTSSHQPGAQEASVLIARAAADLRDRAARRWVEVYDRVLAAALTAPRRSYPVTAMASSGPVQLSEQVLIAHLRPALESVTGPGLVERIDLRLSGATDFDGLVLRVVATFGDDLLAEADRLRTAALPVLRDLLGEVVPEVRVETLHVHYADVVPAREPGPEPGPLNRP